MSRKTAMTHDDIRAARDSKVVVLLLRGDDDCQAVLAGWEDFLVERIVEAGFAPHVVPAPVDERGVVIDRILGAGPACMLLYIGHGLPTAFVVDSSSAGDMWTPILLASDIEHMPVASAFGFACHSAIGFGPALGSRGGRYLGFTKKCALLVLDGDWVWRNAIWATLEECLLAPAGDWAAIFAREMGQIRHYFVARRTRDPYAWLHLMAVKKNTAPGNIHCMASIMDKESA